MSGRASKQKGNSCEYKVRDYFRSIGYSADRVPSSGAAQGYPGDVHVYGKGQDFLVEVKSRKCSFKSIYSMVNDAGPSFAVTSFYYREDDPSPITTLVDMGYSFEMVANANSNYPPYPRNYKRTVKKIMGMRKMLKGASFLVIKDNNKPLLFLRYQ